VLAKVCVILQAVSVLIVTERHRRGCKLDLRVLLSVVSVPGNVLIASESKLIFGFIKTFRTSAPHLNTNNTCAFPKS
jgi:hypothetical protein